ncbi:MAG TPA: hypothetical protein VMW47_12865 [Verrucomicrobiae bacterium]|nr:hypothetical protein [Verrucomicrobiae bacterium]
MAAIAVPLCGIPSCTVSAKARTPPPGRRPGPAPRGGTIDAAIELDGLQLVAEVRSVAATTTSTTFLRPCAVTTIGSIGPAGYPSRARELARGVSWPRAWFCCTSRPICI